MPSKFTSLKISFYSQAYLSSGKIIKTNLSIKKKMLCLQNFYNNFTINHKWLIVTYYYWWGKKINFNGRFKLEPNIVAIALL